MNTGKLVELVTIKSEISKYLENADYQILSQFSYLMLNREVAPQKLEEDLGSSVIESLLQEVEEASYDRLKEIHMVLKAQGIMK